MTETWEQTKQRFSKNLKPLVKPIPSLPQYVSIKIEEKRYNIHQRVLPGLGSKIVGFNLSEKEARQLLQYKYKVSIRIEGEIEDISKSLFPDGVQVDGRLIFYDVLPTDATFEQQDPLYNDSKILKED